MVKTYSVQIPVTGSVIVTVEAESEEKAVAAAWDQAGFKLVFDDPNVCEAGDFELHKQVTRGNVCYAMCNDVNVEEV